MPGYGVGSEQRQKLTKFPPSTSYSGDNRSAASTSRAQGITQITEAIDNVNQLVTNLEFSSGSCINCASSTKATSTPEAGILNQPSAYSGALVVHPVRTPFAEYCIAASAFPAHTTWVLTRVLQSLQTRPADHHLGFTHVDSQSAGLEIPLPGAQLFFKLDWILVSDDQIISVEQFPRAASPELA